MREHEKYTPVSGSDSAAFDERCGKKSRFASAMKSSLVPSVVSFFVYVNYVADTQFQFVFAVGRVRSDAAEPKLTKFV